LVGGLLVSGFATEGNILKPESFADLFGAAPLIRSTYFDDSR
jgi:hypothetical protein